MIDSPYRDRVVHVMEELCKMTSLLRDQVVSLPDRHSERQTATRKQAVAIARPAMSRTQPLDQQCLNDAARRKYVRVGWNLNQRVTLNYRRQHCRALFGVQHRVQRGTVAG